MADVAVRLGHRVVWTSARSRVIDRSRVGAGRVESTTIAGTLIVLALVMHHGYLTTAPLASDDWGWVSSDWLRSLSPWPGIWDPTSGVGSSSFAHGYTAPFEALWGALGGLGLGWDVLEKAFYFVPFAVLSVVGPWLLARELLGSARWASLSALIFATNTHVLLRGTAHLTIACAFAVGTLVFWADIRAARSGGRWPLGTGVLLSLQATYDLRIAVLSMWCLLLKAALETCVAHTWDERLSTIRRLAITAAVLAGTQVVWALPLLAHHGDANLPIDDVPLPPYATLGHAFTAHDPLWTGGVLAFRTTTVPWLAYLTPLVAFSALAVRRVRLELVWLLLCALLAAFLIKQDNPPASDVFPWMFAHVPTWNLFRDATKLFWIPAIAYAVLVPYFARAALEALRGRGHQIVAVAAAALLLAFPIVDATSNAVDTAMGRLGGTTVATVRPSSFDALAGMLASDPHRSAVAFLGGAATRDSTIHRFPLASALHPDLELWGTTHRFDPTVSDNDLLSGFCPGGDVPFCYLQPDLFPYLLHETGVGYVVVPVGARVGVMPPGITRAALRSRVSRILGGSPAIVGVGEEAVAVWQLSEQGSMLAVTPVVAQVLAGPDQAGSVLPALVALGVPATYQGSEGADRLPDSLDVVPPVSRTFSVRRAGTYAMVLPAGATVPPNISVNGTPVHVSTVASSPRWSGPVVGPLTLGAGVVTIDGDEPVGPLVGWSAEANRLLDATQPAETPLRSTDDSEAVTFEAPAERWVLMRQGYDPAWTLESSDTHVRADGLLNAFHLPGSAVGGPLEAHYALAGIEKVSTFACIGVWLGTLLLLTPLLRARARSRRRRRRHATGAGGALILAGPDAARWCAWVGLACMALAMASQLLHALGFPASHPGSLAATLTPAGIPFPDSSLYYLSIGMVLAVSSALMRTTGGIVVVAPWRQHTRTEK